MTKTPLELWREAEGDHEIYVALMEEHGHLRPRCEQVSQYKVRCVLPEGHEEAHAFRRKHAVYLGAD